MDPRTRLLAALTLAWTATWIGRAAVSPVAPAMQEDLGLGLDALGLLPTLGVLGAGLGYALAGTRSSTYPRALLLGGLGLVAVATSAAAGASDLAQLAALQALAGVGEGLFYVPALAAVTQAYHGAGGGRALGTLDMGISLGSAAVLLGAVPLLPLLGWRGVFLAAGLAGLAAVAMLATVRIPAPPRHGPADLRAALRRDALPLYAAIALLLGVYFALLYLSPAFLLSRGFSLGDADLLAALAVALGVPWHVAGGIFADRHGAARTMLAFTLLFAGALVVLALPLPGWATAVGVIAAYSLGIVGFVALITLVPRVLGVELAGPAFAVFWTLGYLGGAFGPYLAAAVAAGAGFGTALLGLAAASVLAAASILPLGRGARTRPAASSGE